MKLTRILVCATLVPCFALFLAISQGRASIQTGSLIRFQDGPGNQGGEFGIALAGSPNNTEFVTFCVERTMGMSFSTDFQVTSISRFADDGGVNTSAPDPISAQTAWLYLNFRNQSLDGYTFGALDDFGSGRKSSANALQKAIWFLEGERKKPGGKRAKGFVNAANDEYERYLNDPSYSGNMRQAINRVRVLNLVWADEERAGRTAQSQLTLVPEPGSLVVWSLLGVAGLVGARRRTI